MYGFYQQPYGEQLIRVTGIDGAKAYQMRPNSAVALFDWAKISSTLSQRTVPDFRRFEYSGSRKSQLHRQQRRSISPKQ